MDNENKQSIDEILEEIKNKDIYAADDEQPLDIEEGITISEPRRSEEISDEKPKKKKRRKISVIAWVAAIILLSAVLSIGAIMTFTDLMGLTMGEDIEYEIEIPEGASTQDIAEILHEAGVVRYPLIFRIYSKLTDADGTYQYGLYDLKSSSGYEGIVDKLQTIGTIANQVKITIPERASINDIIKIFEDNDFCTKAEFKKAMDNGKYNYKIVEGIPKQSVYYLLEGYLFPETYYFFYDKDDGEKNAERAINKMISQLDSSITDEMYKKADDLGRSMHEILTLASIVELEASGNHSEMKNVAQVFYNRLSWDEAKLLGSTPTADYPSERYNTNKYEGLPPGPLCSPSLDAINAALEPNTELDATYFVTDKNMKFYYNTTLSAHNATIASLKNKGLWEY